MTRVPNHPPRPNRLEETPEGLALIIGEPNRSEAARVFLAELDKRVAELAARDADTK